MPLFGAFIWCLYLEPIFGAYIWSLYLVPLLLFWCLYEFLEPLFGAFIWSLYLVPLFGAFIWCLYLVPIFGAFIRSLLRWRAWCLYLGFAVRHQIKAQSGAFTWCLCGLVPYLLVPFSKFGAVSSQQPRHSVLARWRLSTRPLGGFVNVREVFWHE